MMKSTMNNTIKSYSTKSGTVYLGSSNLVMHSILYLNSYKDF